MTKSIRPFNLTLPFFTEVLLNSFHPFIILVFTHLFLSHQSQEFLLPLIFYYSLKSSVLFLFRSKPKTAMTLFKYGVFAGLLGCLIAFFSGSAVILFSVAGLLLGMCSGVLLPSYATLKRQRESRLTPELLTSEKWLDSFCSLAYLGGMAQLIQSHSSLVFLLLGGALIWLFHQPAKNPNLVASKATDYPKYAVMESIILFVVLFSAVFVLKQDKKEGITHLLPEVMIGLVVLGIGAGVYRYWKQPERRVSVALSGLIIYKGMLSNFILAFLTFYQVIKRGARELIIVYLLYLVGTTIRGSVMTGLKKKMSTNTASYLVSVGLGSSFILLLFQPSFYVGLLLLAIFLAEFNRQLDNYVYQHLDLPVDYRLFAKARLTNIGSLINQVIMFATLYLASYLTKTEVLDILKAYHSQKESLDFISVLNATKNSLLVIFMVYLLVSQRLIRKVEEEEERP